MDAGWTSKQPEEQAIKVNTYTYQLHIGVAHITASLNWSLVTKVLIKRFSPMRTPECFMLSRGALIACVSAQSSALLAMVSSQASGLSLKSVLILSIPSEHASL